MLWFFSIIFLILLILPCFILFVFLVPHSNGKHRQRGAGSGVDWFGEAWIRIGQRGLHGLDQLDRDVIAMGVGGVDWSGHWRRG